jgi:multidrug efflux system membrane fusion protein
MVSRRQRQFLAIGFIALAAGGVGWVALHRAPAKAAAPKAVPVTAAQVVTSNLPLTLSVIGSAQAWTSDTIFAQASGRLLSVDFTEGADVKAGQLLAQVDPRPYQAALEQAEGTLKRDQGVLEGAKRDLARFKVLVAQNAIARQIYEDEIATVAQDEGAVQMDQGAVAAAKVNLDYCRITSPIDGRAGVRLVDPGNLVSAAGGVASTPSTAAATSNAASSGSSMNSTTSAMTANGGGVGSGSGASGTGIVVINQIQPIAVTFTVPEGDLQRVVAAADSLGHPLQVLAYSQETGQLLDSGELSALDNRVDPATGTVELKARFANAARHLWPGQFVNAKIVLNTVDNAILMPNAAVNRGPNGQYVFVIGPDHHVAIRPVSVVSVQNGSAIVRTGVRAGETVVTDGQMSLRAGSLVRVAQMAPKPSTAP